MKAIRIAVKVWGSEAIVRKTVLNDDGMVLAKYGLSATGQWIRVMEGDCYPAVCKLEVTVEDAPDVDDRGDISVSMLNLRVKQGDKWVEL